MSEVCLEADEIDPEIILVDKDVNETDFKAKEDKFKEKFVYQTRDKLWSCDF